jgi:hypothetical protein
MPDPFHADLDDPHTWPTIGWVDATPVPSFLDGLEGATVEWKDPEPVTLSIRVDIEELEIFIGPLLELCQREIPAKGTE